MVIIPCFQAAHGVLPAWGRRGRRRKSRKAEETIKPSMTRLSFVKLLETRPKFAHILVCLCVPVELWLLGG